MLPVINKPDLREVQYGTERGTTFQGHEPVAAHTHQYTSADGKEHTVLVILNGKDNTMYKTEVKAFIEKYLTYEESFGSLPDDQKPEIKIIINTSKAGNRYVNFELMEK